MRLTSMSKTAATPSMWRTTIERLRRHIAEMVELAGAARRLDPYAQTAGGCAPSGAAPYFVRDAQRRRARGAPPPPQGGQPGKLDSERPISSRANRAFAPPLRSPARSGQLQHRCVLAFAQLGEQHGLPVGELQRIVMHARPR